MATVKYRGLSGTRVVLTVNTSDTLTTITNAAIADEGLNANYYADFFLLRDNSVLLSNSGAQTYAQLNLTADDELVAVLDDDPATYTKQERQVRKLEIASIQRKDDGYANHVYDLTSLPDTYNGNVPGADDNPNTDGLLPKRPWIEVGAIAAPTSIGESVSGDTLVDLQVWYDGADTTTIIPNATDESQITQWTDKSDFAHNANPDGGSAKPTYENTVLQGGYGYLEFDGNDQLSINPFTQLQSQAGFTVFIVHKGTGGLTATNTDDLKVGIDSATSMTYGMNGYANTQSGLTDADQWMYTTLVFNAGNTILRLKGSEVANVTQGAATTNAGNTTFYIGYDGNSNFTGFIAEVILFNKALGSTEYTNVENYLKTKWGL
jgi:hypothetical protein